MPRIVNSKWRAEMQAKVDSGAKVDETLAFAKAKQALIFMLSATGRPYKVHKMGCGADRITTDTEKCPLCASPYTQRRVECKV